MCPFAFQCSGTSLPVSTGRSRAHTRPCSGRSGCIESTILASRRSPCPPTLSWSLVLPFCSAPPLALPRQVENSCHLPAQHNPLGTERGLPSGPAPAVGTSCPLGLSVCLLLMIFRIHEEQEKLPLVMFKSYLGNGKAKGCFVLPVAGE